MSDNRPHYLVCNSDHRSPRGGDICICGKLDEQEIARLHALLVKACVEIARRMVDESPLTLAEITACIKEDYGIDLRYTREGWKEDTTNEPHQ